MEHSNLQEKVRSNLKELMLRLIFPPKCIICGEIMDIDAAVELCDICYEKIPLTTELDSDKSEDFYNELYCLGRYEGVLKDALLRFKYSEKPSYYRSLGQLLAEKIMDSGKKTKFDIIISVPLSRRRRRKRGYNQAFLIGKEVGKFLKCDVKDNMLKRIKDTKSQKELSRKEREENLRDAFTASDGKNISGRDILLIDDIMTTGTTLRECSKALKEAGAARITAAVIASGRQTGM